MWGGILEFASWGRIFVPTAVLAAAAGAFALVQLPESKAAEGRQPDWPGQISATVAIAASIYGIIAGGEKGWTASETILALAVAAIASVAFVVLERRSSPPLMNLKLFGSPTFSAAGFSSLIALFAIVGSMFLLSLSSAPCSSAHRSRSAGGCCSSPASPPR